MLFVDRRYRIWFNTVSIDESDREWTRKTPGKRYTIDELRHGSRRHTVTHVVLWNDIPPDIHNLFPRLTHLVVKEVRFSADYRR